MAFDDLQTEILELFVDAEQYRASYAEFGDLNIYDSEATKAKKRRALTKEFDPSTYEKNYQSLRQHQRNPLSDDQRKRAVEANRVRRKRLREAAAKDGKCIMCIQADAEPNRSLCKDCNTKNTERARLRRERKQTDR